MRTLKKAVVDIDNTLWHFCGPLYEGLKKINPAFPPPEFWIDWNFWMRYCSEDEFMGVIHEIHLNQDDDMNLPYSEAGDFLLRLKENGFHIVIASHRRTESLARTRRWLLKHDLVFDDIHWSQEMNEAWEQIKLHPQVQVTIDLFQLGIVFFKKELSKEHFVLRY